MMERPKMGFGIPVQDWLAKEQKSLVEEHLKPAALKEHGLFKEEAVTNLCAEFFNGRTEKYLKIWYLLMFQMWYKKWVV